MCAVSRTGGYITCSITGNRHYFRDLPHKNLQNTINVITISYNITKYSWDNFHSTLEHSKNCKNLAQSIFHIYSITNKRLVFM